MNIYNRQLRVENKGIWVNRINQYYTTHILFTFFFWHNFSRPFHQKLLEDYWTCRHTQATRKKKNTHKTNKHHNSKQNNSHLPLHEQEWKKFKPGSLQLTFRYANLPY